MDGDKEIIALLNEQLTAELTAINQYFLHAKMQENWGFTKLAKHTRHESIDEMKHAEVLTDRILFLEGLPNYQKLNPLRIGQTVPEQLRADLKIEMEAVDRLRGGIELMRSRGDATSARIFESILEDEESHVDYLETELDLIEKLGEQLYLQRYTDTPEDD
ncbi:bacterioferritin [Nocardia vinacea]|uniref:bacterioferritin n=1 Tax=Nocardia vinacea TaxID=96468 RepID=UPI002E0D3668|nr:bacterioferritin [Nocardia vinacea]